jgi:signal transduction histidine kinase
MSPSTLTDAAMPSWLRLGQASPYDAFAQAAGTAMLTIALLQLLCSLYTDARALRIFALLYLATGIGWLVAHPRAHGGAADVPLIPAMVAVLLLGMNVWGLYEFLGLARRRAWLIVLGTATTGLALALWLRAAPGSAVSVYGVMAGGFALCAWLAARAARLEGNVGHLYVVLAYATYPVLFAMVLLLPSWLAGFELGYYAAVPGMIVGMMIVAVSLIRARRRTEFELERRVHAEESLRQLNNSLEERVAARTRELNDLRDPLAGMSGLARLGTIAVDSDDKHKARIYLSTIHAQAAQMTVMVQGLLQLSHLAHAPLQRRRQGLRRSVDEALAQLRLTAPMTQALAQVRVDVQPLPDGEIDADLMRQVFVNLIGNALKFTAARGGSDGCVTVSPCASRHGGAVCVEDNGLGLPEGRENDLFRPFARLHGSAVSGSGIGLALVRRIVEAHGGRIWAERVPTGGARFLFTIDGLTG